MSCDAYLVVLRYCAEVQLLDELRTLEFQEPRVPVHAPIERHGDFPRSCKNLRVLDGGFVHQVVRTDRGVAFDHVQRVAVVVPGPVEPCLVVEPCDIDDQRVPFPAPIRPSHPRLVRSFRRLAERYLASCVRVLVQNPDHVRTLEDLKRVGQIRRSRDTRKKAIQFGVGRRDSGRPLRGSRSCGSRSASRVPRADRESARPRRRSRPAGSRRLRR